MPSTDSTTPPTTALLTLLNVSATRPGKRRRFADAAAAPSARVKLGGRAAAAVVVAEAAPTTAAAAAGVGKETQMEVDDEAQQVADVDAAVESDDEAAPAPSAAAATVLDGHTAHFASEGKGTHAQHMAETYPNAPEGKLALEWSESAAEGSAKMALGEGARCAKVEGFEKVEAKPHANVLAALQKLRQDAPLTASQRALLHTVGTYSDILQTRSRGTSAESADMRQVLAVHALSHLIKTRRRILRNNEKLAHAASSGSSMVSPRDQGFTRPTILILLPLRSSALAWGELLYLLSGCETHDGSTRLEREFGPRSDDAAALVGYTGPVELAGNSDDSFRFGAKLTRKTWKSFTGWYDSDVIVASPLGLRLAIEKDREADFLSSIEVVIADQMDVMLMQNWEHVQLIFSQLSQIPKASHGTDFSRVKQWHLDGRAAHFRQTILLSAYDAPELRATWRSLSNVAGKLRTGAAEEGVMHSVKEGIRQTFTRFDCANLNAEADLRFQTFTNKTLPTLLKSAVSATRTLIFVPSYFDFVRLDAHLRTLDGVTFAAVSEYSSNKDVARARQQFFTEKKMFLLVTERFHFYRRFTLRGAQTLVFYALPEHASYYVDVLSFPFAPPRTGSKADERPTLDAGDVSAVTLYSKYDLMRLERVVGTALAHRMIGEEKGTWRWA